ncbi:MAG: hypothetical protein GY811_13110 [Myxococcales bacterium]|nr:hypothetical protein [Myxococcales bacterium]
MYRFLSTIALPIWLLLATACSGSDGSGGGGDDPDADVDANADADLSDGICSPATVINAYPANFSGNVVGAGADLNVEVGVCDDERSHYPQEGEDQVIRLDNLTPGTGYVVQLDAPSDLAFYVVSDCTGADPVAGECLVFTDEELGQSVELADFTAPASGTVFVVVDHYVDETAPQLADGTYTLSVVEPECEEDMDCSGTPNTPFCSAFECVACSTSFQCDSAEAPVCDGTTNTCVAGSDTCTPDDASESGDDGPAGAASIAVPTAGSPTVVNASICSDPLTEIDFYTIVLAAETDLVFSLEWTAIAGDPDLDLVLVDGDGLVVNSSFIDNPEVLVQADLAAGTYYLAVSRYEPDGTPTAASIPYTLSASVTECENSFDCETAGAPVCSPADTCVAGSTTCTSDTDDDGDPTANDGPASATTLTAGAPATNAAICNSPASERDYYAVTVVDGDNLTITVGYADNAAADLDVSVLDSDGNIQGFTYWENPEVVELTFLPAGTYFVEVSYFGAEVTVAHPYTIAAATTAGTCTSTADCAAVFGTQIYRGDCNLGTGACSSIEGNEAFAQDAACDSADDCTSGVCSYALFQESANLSVCTIACNATTECTAAHGDGFSCTVPFINNFCHPDCTGNLECGANTNSATLDTGEPWDYLLCNAGACELDS